MGFFIFLILIVGVIAVVASASGENKAYKHYRGTYNCDYNDYDDYEDDYKDDFEDFETRAAMGERDYFTDDAAKNYDSYYAQIADAADMGDQEAIDEMNGEFGGDW